MGKKGAAKRKRSDMGKGVTKRKQKVKFVVKRKRIGDVSSPSLEIEGSYPSILNGVSRVSSPPLEIVGSYPSILNGVSRVSSPPLEIVGSYPSILNGVPRVSSPPLEIVGSYPSILNGVSRVSSPPLEIVGSYPSILNGVTRVSSPPLEIVGSYPSILNGVPRVSSPPLEIVGSYPSILNGVPRVSSPSLEIEGSYHSVFNDVSSSSLEIKGCSTNACDDIPCSSIEMIGDNEHALQRTTNLYHNAFPDMKQSGCKEFDFKSLAEIFELQGNKAMQSQLYPGAIDCYNVAIALGGDNAIYYCNRAAAYIQTCQYAEVILDCQKSIAIDPCCVKAYTRLGYIYSVQGIRALEKGYRIATLLDPTSEFVRENVRAAEHKIWQQREESGQASDWSYSNGFVSVRDQVPSPLFGNNSGAGLRARAMAADTNPEELYAVIRADISFLMELSLPTRHSNGN